MALANKKSEELYNRKTGASADAKTIDATKETILQNAFNDKEYINDNTNLIFNDLEDITFHYAKTLSIWRENFNNEIENVKKLGFSEVKAVGGKNQPRPLSYSGGLYVSAGGKKTKEIGSTITDITTTFGGKDKVYLSLKFGDTLTFINSGVGTCAGISVISSPTASV